MSPVLLCILYLAYSQDTRTLVLSRVTSATTVGDLPISKNGMGGEHYAAISPQQYCGHCPGPSPHDG